MNPYKERIDKGIIAGPFLFYELFGFKIVYLISCKQDREVVIGLIEV